MALIDNVRARRAQLQARVAQTRARVQSRARGSALPTLPGGGTAPTLPTLPGGMPAMPTFPDIVARVRARIYAIRYGGTPTMPAPVVPRHPVIYEPGVAAAGMRARATQVDGRSGASIGGGRSQVF